MKIKMTYSEILILTITALLTTWTVIDASEMDERIESAVEQSYVFKVSLKDDAVKVQSKNGIVTLRGSVADEFRKSLAEETVAVLPGVKKVENHLRIKIEHNLKNGDGWVSMKVKATLLFNRHLSLSKTEVVVKDGIVTLKGLAENEAQRELTAEYVKDVEGVKGVKNEITFPKAEKKAGGNKTISKMIDDASITARIKLILLYHRSTSALYTKVVTNDGVVTLSGQSRNAVEKDLVTKLVSDIKGVRIVNNQMIIEEKIKTD